MDAFRLEAAGNRLDPTIVSQWLAAVSYAKTNSEAKGLCSQGCTHASFGIFLDGHISDPCVEREGGNFPKHRIRLALEVGIIDGKKVVRIVSNSNGGNLR